MDVEGPDAVTIRRIAQEFGVTPMALYWHVANKEELLAAVGDSFFDGMQPPAAEGSWSSQLRVIVQTLIESFSKHPAAAPLSLSRALACQPGLDIAEHTMKLLCDAGFTVAQACDLSRMALQTAVMLVTQFPGNESQVAAAQREEVVAAKRAHIASLRSDRYPHLVDAAIPLTDCDDPAGYFGFGVDLYIEGAEALLRRYKRAAKTAR